MVHTRSSNSLLREGLNNDGFVARGVDKFVVQDLDASIVARQLHNLIRDSLRIREGRNILADAGKIEHNILGVGTAQLGFGLLPDQDKVVVAGLLGEHAASLTRQTRVDTAAKALVARRNDEQRLLLRVLALGLERLGLGALKDLVGRLPVLAAVLHGTGGASQLGGGYDLHRLGDLLDVADRLEAAFDFAQSGIASGILGDAAISLRQ